MAAALLFLALIAPPGEVVQVTVSDQRAAVEATDALLPEILEAIAAEAQLDVVYPPGALRPRLTIQIPEAPLEETLEALFEAAGIEYEVETRDDRVTLVRVVVTPMSPREWVEKGGSLDTDAEESAELPEGMSLTSPAKAGGPEPPRPSKPGEAAVGRPLPPGMTMGPPPKDVEPPRIPEAGEASEKASPPETPPEDASGSPPR